MEGVFYTSFQKMSCLKENHLRFQVSSFLVFLVGKKRNGNIEWTQENTGFWIGFTACTTFSLLPIKKKLIKKRPHFDNKR